jgi:hypothetical protein
MQWRDLAFLHWPVDTGAAARLMPPGARPDLFHGVSYAGVIAFRMHDVGGGRACPRCRTWDRFPRPTCGCTRWDPTADGEWCSAPWTRPGWCRRCSAGRPSAFPTSGPGCGFAGAAT